MAHRRSLCAKVRACRKGRKGGKRHCKFGKNKRTGRCLKHKRARR
ncbi:MAG: hypothetical protein Q8S13_08675 [Dehalococcoidia bacterium]|nr:hypothetical protein [Dehalococcoidia bacterium]